jgi:hypothetical protein
MIQVGEHRWRCSNNQSMETSKKQQPKTKNQSGWQTHLQQKSCGFNVQLFNNKLM